MNIRRMAIVSVATALVFLVTITFVSFAAGVFFFAICHCILSLSFRNHRIVEFVLGTRLSEVHKENLRRVGSSPVFIIILILINCVYLGLAIYTLIVLNGLNLINIIK